MQDQTTAGGIQLKGTRAGLIRTAVDSGAPVIAGKLRVRSLSYVAIDQDEYTTRSTEFVPILDVTVSFRLKGSRRSDILGVFSAMSFGGRLEIVNVRARLDQSKPSVPSEVQFSGADDASARDYTARSHAFQFVFRKVRPGRHQVAIDFRSFSGDPAFIHRPLLVVTHG
jgi:hypothetical protein